MLDDCTNKEGVSVLRSLSISWRFARFLLSTFLQYVVVFIMTLYATPLVVSYIAGAAGLTSGATDVNLVALFLFPSLFAVLLLLVLTVFICIAIHRSTIRFFIFLSHKLSQRVSKTKV